MRRLLLTLLLAHVVASYGVIVGLTLRYGGDRAEAWLLAPVVAPVAVWDVTRDPRTYKWAAVAAVDGSYVACFAATLAWRRVAGRESRRALRRRKGLCTECGYDLTGNITGRCPECGMHVNPKARLMVRRGG